MEKKEEKQGWRQNNLKRRPFLHPEHEEGDKAEEEEERRGRRGEENWERR